MLGVVLLALAAVIGLGFGVFAIAKGIANEGTVNVQDSLASVSSQAFLDYDQKIVTGTQVIAGYKTFEGKPYAVLIQTKALLNGREIHPDHDAYIVEVGANGDVGVPITGSTGEIFINYNAIIAHPETGVPPRQVAGGTGDITSGDLFLYKKNGSYYIKNNFTAVNGNVVFDNQTEGLFKTGNAEYIPSGSKFHANLLKDESENYLGIVFQQI